MIDIPTTVHTTLLKIVVLTHNRAVHKYETMKMERWNTNKAKVIGD